MMSFHLSIEADDPFHVAHVLAHLMGGHAAPSSRSGREAWLAHADNGWGALIEVRGGAERLRRPGAIDGEACEAAHDESPVAIVTALDAGQVFRLAAEQGWPAYTRRGNDGREAIEIQVERGLTVAVMTPTMQAGYINAFAARQAVPLRRLA